MTVAEPTAPAALPHWDMTPFFPALDAPEFAAAFDTAVDSIATLSALFDELQIAKHTPHALDDGDVAAWERVAPAMDAVVAQVRLLSSYVYSFVSTDSRNNAAQARQSVLQNHLVKLSQLTTRLTAWLGSLDAQALIARSPLAAEHAWMIEKAQHEAAHMMSPAEEALAAELSVSASTAWAKLHGNLTSQLTVAVEVDGKTEQLPMSVVRTFAFEADRDLRRRAYEAEVAGWATAALPLAAAINSIKGQVNTVSAKRGWATPLEAGVWENNIDLETLDAMMTAAREAFPDFRRYLHAKAHALGIEQTTWYDMFAPVGALSKSWSYEEARSFIVEQFATYSPKLSAFAERAFDENWIDAEPHTGKHDGAYCMLLRGDESRVFANFKPSFSSMSTLAHELGHAYHNLCLAPHTMLQHDTPMTLAETASIFCQTIINQAALADASRDEQIAILDESLQDACQVVVDITSRFLFEQRVFEQRRERELSVEELCAVMRDAQAETYGDGLDPASYHTYMWAMKGHYYSTRSFYNYPYMFGLLFGLGLYAQYKQDPDRFRASYDDLLSSTGLGDAATLAERFNINIRTPDFWRGSFDTIRADIARFEALVKGE